MTLTGRIGIFFIFMSLIVLLVFYVTIQSGEPNLTALFVGIVGLILGGLMAWRSRPPPPPDERFRSLRASRTKRAEKKQKNKEEMLE